LQDLPFNHGIIVKTIFELSDRVSIPNKNIVSASVMLKSFLSCYSKVVQPILNEPSNVGILNPLTSSPILWHRLMVVEDERINLNEIIQETKVIHDQFVERKGLGENAIVRTSAVFWEMTKILCLLFFLMSM